MRIRGGPLGPPREEFPATRRSVAVAITLMTAFLALSGSNGAGAAPNLHLDARCTPGTIRPNTEAVFTCITGVTSDEGTAIRNVAISGIPAPDLSLPSYEIFDRTVNGALVAVSPDQTSFDFPEIPQYETVDAVSRVIFGVRDAGSYGVQLNLIVDGTVVDSKVVRIEATLDSPNPPAGLQVTETLVGVGPGPPPQSPPEPLYTPEPFPPRGEKADYEIVIKNTSSAAVSSLTAWDHQSPGAEIGANSPPAAEIDASTQLARWELGALAPGAEQRVDLTVLRSAGQCPLSSNTVVVTAHRPPSDDESYLARADKAIRLGLECPLGQGGDGLGAPTASAALPTTGSDGGRGAGPWLWLLVASLAGAAITLGAGSYRLRKD